jgi:hypothetical protein
MSELREFQGAFSRALLHKPFAGDEARVASFGTALTIHRNTVIKGLVDALAANYPTIAQLVGREWFDACAVQYVRACPARSPALVLYGEAFPSFLSAFGPAAELPYLAEVARIDRLWSEAHAARAVTSLPADALAELSPSALFEQRIPFHPATRFGWFSHSAATVWLHHRSGPPDAQINIDDCDEGLLLTRPFGAVEYAALDRAGFIFLDQLRAGTTLGEAATAALEINVETDVAHQLAQFVTAGTFVAARGDHP